MTAITVIVGMMNISFRIDTAYCIVPYNEPSNVSDILYVYTTMLCGI